MREFRRQLGRHLLECWLGIPAFELHSMRRARSETKLELLLLLIIYSRLDEAIPLCPRMLAHSWADMVVLDKVGIEALAVCPRLMHIYEGV